MKKSTIYDLKDLKSVLDSLPAGTSDGSRKELAGGCVQEKPDYDRGIPEHIATGSHYSVKPGTRVVLMDSDLTGMVLEAGRDVKIELEDGMVITVEYGAFAEADPEEEKKLLESPVKVPPGEVHEVAKTPIRNHIRVTGANSMEVDLHVDSLPGGHSVPDGQQLEYQLACFRRVLNENLRHRGMRISFIHGVGEGVLRNMLCRELDEVYAMKCSYSTYPAVTVVTVR